MMTDLQINSILNDPITLQDNKEEHAHKKRRRESVSNKTAPSPPRTPPQEINNELRLLGQGEFESNLHFYPRCLNAQIHPLVQSFFALGNDRIIARYTHLNPRVKPDYLKEILSYRPTHFQWAGK